MKTYEVSGESKTRIYNKYFFKVKTKSRAIKLFFKKIGGIPFKKVKATEIKKNEKK